MTALIRDRYHTVVEERNAYQAMQSEMTGAIDTQSSLAKSREQQRQQLEQEVEKHRHLYLDAFNYLQISLVELGVRSAPPPPPPALLSLDLLLLLFLLCGGV